jgi:hypothetical protein
VPDRLGRVGTTGAICKANPKAGETIRKAKGRTLSSKRCTREVLRRNKIVPPAGLPKSPVRQRLVRRHASIYSPWIGVRMIGIHSRRWILLVSAVAATAILCSCRLLDLRSDRKKVSPTEDEVYEAIVRDMMAQSHHDSIATSQLVFDNTVLSDLEAKESMASCKERVRKEQSLERSTPQFNSLPDKIYRILTLSSWNDRSLRADTIEDFLEKSCTTGSVSTTFHTDLPRTFIIGANVHFEGWPIMKDETASFEQVFPGAAGIISFSHVGFDSALHEAVVSVSFVCGGLCGTGWRYILEKKRGRWEVTSKLMRWMS